MPIRNQKRGLADVVTLDAWHQEFGAAVDTADLHVDVVFMTGRIGGVAEDQVRFKLSLKRAEVVVVLPVHEPAEIDPRSVSRDAPCFKGEASETRKSSRQAGAAVRVNAAAGPTSLSGGGALELHAEGSASRERTLEITQSIQGMTITQNRTDDGEYRWIVAPAIGDVLEGRPWDSETRRLAVTDRRAERTGTLPPALRVEVRCRREDLHITEIALRDDQRWNLLKLGPDHRNKMAAAEALIRTRLFEEGLMTPGEDLSDPYARMTLTAVAAEGVR